MGVIRGATIIAPITVAVESATTPDVAMTVAKTKSTQNADIFLLVSLPSVWSSDVARALRRIAHEILEHNKGPDDLVVLGIPSRGVELANRLVDLIREVEGAEVPVGSLDITMHRDDLRHQPTRAPMHTSTARSSSSSTTCSTPGAPSAPPSTRWPISAARARCAGRPVDRGHRELPIRADHVGKNLPTSQPRRSSVRLAENDGEDRRALSRGGRPMKPPAQHRRPVPRRVARSARDRRGCTTCSAAHQEAPALRGRTVINLFFEDSTRTRSVVRDRRQVDERRHHQHHRQGLERQQGRVAARHRDDDLDAMGVDAIVIRHSASGAVTRSPAGCDASSSTPATAPTSTPPRRCWTPTRCAAAPTTSATLEGKHVASSATCCTRGCSAPTSLLRTLGAPGHRRRPADADAERRRDVGVPRRLTTLDDLTPSLATAPTR
jgi:pyrimidine operon attenuation protein/uracil phosphoribosyltransferase